MDADQRRDARAMEMLIDVLANNPNDRIASTNEVRELLLIPRRARREEAEAAFERAAVAWLEKRHAVIAV